MKRKYFSALLMAAMTVASTSMVTSCKDYDDDINALKTEITNNAATLTSLVDEKVKNLTTELNNLKSQQTTLEQQLATAKSELETAVAKVKTDANAYTDVQAAAAKTAAIEAAQKNLEDAIATVNAAIKSANSRIDEVNTQVNTNAESISKLLDADADLQKAIEVVKADAASAAQKALDAANAAQTTADNNTEELKKVADNLTQVKSDLEKSISLLGDKVDANTATIAANKADVDAQLATVNSLISANADAITALQNADADMLKKITKNSEDLLALQTQLATVEAECQANLVAANAYADAQVAALKEALGAEISTVKTDLAAAIDRIAASETAISKLSAEFDEEKAAQKIVNDNVSTSIKTLQDNIAAANEKIQSNTTAIATAVVDLTKKIEDTQSELNTAIANAKEELNGKISTNSNSISTLQNTAVKLQSAIDKNATDISDLQSELARVKSNFSNYVTNATLGEYKQQVADAISQATSELGTSLRSELTDKVADLNSSISSLQKKDTELANGIRDLQEKINEITGTTGYVEALQTQIDNLNNTLNNYAKASDLNDLVSKHNALQSNYNTLSQNFEAFKTQYGTEISEISEMIAANLETVNMTIMQVTNLMQDQIDTLVGISKQLKSLVFSPETYYQGIEAINIDAFFYNPVSGLATADLTKDQSTDAPTYGSEKAVAPISYASYYLNPSNASINLAAKNFKFIVSNATYTRSVNAADLNVDSVKTDADVAGKINVFFTLKNAQNLANIASDSKVDVAALRYTYKSADQDTTITSDFAALKQYKMKGLTLAVENSGIADAKSHLAKKAALAVAANSTYPVLKLSYTDEKGIDLDQTIAVHYDIDGNHEYWGKQAEVNKKNFTLKYELIGYKKDGVQQSEAAKIEKNVLLPNGNYINRTPLMRVTMVDNHGKAIATVGYILVKLVDDSDIDKTYETATINNDFTVMCDGLNIVDQNIVTLAKIEENVLSDLHITNKEFEANYVCDSKQYTQDETGKFVEATSNVGTVTVATDKSLKWTVTASQAYTLFVTEGKESVSTWVKYTPIATSPSKKPVYVKLSWKPAKKNIAPVAEILDSYDHKKMAPWHKANVNEKGFDQLHIQVGNATDPNATCDYSNLVIANTFNKSVLDIVKEGLGTTYQALANEAQVSFTFAPVAEQTHKEYTGVSGETYKVTVKDDGTEIYANGNLLATIITNNGTVNINENSDAVKDILNKYSNLKDLTNALTLTIKAKATTCAPAENLINLKNNKFDVKVIKPIFVENATIDGMQLNKYSTLTQPVKFTFKDFNGYSQEKFYEYSEGKKDFFSFYEIKSIKQVGTIMTDYSGARKALDEKDFKITYTAPTSFVRKNGVVSNMGSITLTQVNMARTNSYNVWVPIEVEYKWGKLTTEVKIAVQAADAAAAKKHY